MALPKWLKRATETVERGASEHELSVAEGRPCPDNCGDPAHQHQRNQMAADQLRAQFPPRII